MKKLYTLALTLGLFGFSNAQFSDDFESYATGDYLGKTSPVWRTWSNTGEGTPEDVKIIDTDASSGTKSIYLSSTAQNGGLATSFCHLIKCIPKGFLHSK